MPTTLPRRVRHGRSFGSEPFFPLMAITIGVFGIIFSLLILLGVGPLPDDTAATEHSQEIGQSP